MEVCEAKEPETMPATTVGNFEGRTCVQVGGRDATPGESSGWIAASRRMRKTKDQQGERPTLASERQSRPKERANFTKRVTENIKRAARMPATIPREDHKIVIRPRGGLNMAKIETSVVTGAIMAAAGTVREHEGEDTVCVNAAQNILVVSTPSEERAEVYARVKTIEFGNMEYEVYAYRTAPEGTVKGVIRGIAIDETPEDINEAIVTKYNPLALEAHRIGNSTAVIVLFEGHRVPRYVKYRAALIKCGLYRKHHEVCRCCGKVGHRIDVCPTPEARVCFACGIANPNAEHEGVCKPRCKLCGGAHPTGDRVCKNKFKVPFVVTKRRWERRTGLEQQQLQKTKPPKTSDFPHLQASKERSESRRRSTSCGRNASRQEPPPPPQREGKLTWSGAVKGAKAEEVPRGKQQQQRSEEKPTRKEVYDMIRESSERMLKMIDDKIDKLIEALRSNIQPMAQTQTQKQEQAAPEIPAPMRKEETAVTEEEATKSNIESDEEHPTEPSNKKRIIENTKERRLMARLDRMDREREQLAKTTKDKFSKMEKTLQDLQSGMRQMQTQLQTFMQSMESQTQAFMQNVETQINTKLQQLWTQQHQVQGPSQTERQ